MRDAAMPKRLKSWAVCFLSPVMMALAAPTDAAAEAAPYRGVDVIRGLRDDGQGIQSVATAAKHLEQYAKTVTVTPGARQAYAFADEVIQSVDFGRVFKSNLAKVMPDGARTFALTGSGQSQRYVVDYKKEAIDSLSADGFLGFAADLRVGADKNPIPDEELAYGIVGRAKVNTGDMSHRTLLRGAYGILRVLDPANLEKLPAAPNAPGKGLDQKLIGEARSTMPDSQAMFERYFTAVPGVSIENAQGTPYTQVKSRATLNLAQLQKDYPELGNYVENLVNKLSFKATGRYELPNGLIVGEATLDSTIRQATITWKTRGGHIVPYEKNGTPRFDAEIDPSTLKTHAGVAIGSVSGSLLGFTFKLSNAVFNTNFVDGATAKLGGKLTKLPPPQIEGRAFGIVPQWAIDVFIPGSIEGYGRKFAEGISHGYKGAGTYAEAKIDTWNPSATMVTGSASTEVIDNFFLKFGLRFIQKYLWPNEAVIASAWKCSTASAVAFSKDMARLQATVASTAPTAQAQPN